MPLCHAVKEEPSAMECVSYTIEAEVPPDFLSAVTCSTAFYKVFASINQLEGTEVVRKRTLFTTARGHLLEVEGGEVMRSTLCPKDVTKIVVHHSFEPLQLYVVLLCDSGMAVLLAYQDLEVLHKWEGVTDVSSFDPTASGTPQLTLTKQNDKVAVSNVTLMKYSQSDDKERNEEEEEEEEGEEEKQGRNEVVQALMHQFKGGIQHVERLKTESNAKENFIVEELAALKAQLRGNFDAKEKSLIPDLDVEIRGAKPEEHTPALPPSPLRVGKVYHKLVHDKWVVGVNVVNDAEHTLVSQLGLTLYCGEVPLCHTSRVLKTVKHTRRELDKDRDINVRISIEDLNPSILKPKKKATVIGVCEMPLFETGPSVTCSGLLTYTCKPLRGNMQPLEVNNRMKAQEYQISVPMLELKASELASYLCLDLCNTSKSECVSFSTVALVAASETTSVCFTSVVSPLNTFLTKISRHMNVFKVSGLTDFYVLYPGKSHPLQYTGFTLHPVDSHTLELNLYTRDEKQALILVHTLLAALPGDITVDLKQDSRNADNTHMLSTNLHHMLLAKMKEAAALVTEGLEEQLSTSKALRVENDKAEEEEFAKYSKERKELLSKKGDITFQGKDYAAWRDKLRVVQSEVDDLYFDFLKLNCALD